MELILSTAAFKRICYLLLVSIIAFLLFHLLVLPAKAWLLWNVLLLALITDGTPVNRIKRIALTGIAAAMLTLVIGLSHVWHALAVALLFMTTFACIYIGERYRSLAYSAFVVNLGAVLAAMNSVTLTITMLQAFFILCAALIVIFIRALFMLVSNPLNELRSWMVTALKHLSMLNEEIYSCLLDEKYNQNLYLFERRVHIQKNKFLQSLIYLRYQKKKLRLDPKEAHHVGIVLARLEEVHDIIIDCSQLRRRVSDPTIFAVCKDELSEIASAIQNEFAILIRKTRSKQVTVNGLDTLTMRIKRLEESFFSVLQVTAREPLVFLLFISSLKDLRERLMLLQQEL